MIILKSNSDKPLYQQIYEQLKKQIISGELSAGAKLTSTRTLSTILNVSRNTVENAYLQLCSEGYIESKPGSGYIVLEVLPEVLFADNNKSYDVNNSLKNAENNSNKKINTTDLSYDFEYGKLSSSDFPLKIWRKVSNKALATLTAEDMISYSESKGELNFRIEIMNYLTKSRGVSCNTDQIIVCTGFAYCLSLICQLLRQDFDEIAIEDPGYFGTRDIFANNGYKVSPISVDKDGINIAELEKSAARIVYITPSHQFPTGAVMPIQKRLKLLDWAIKNDGIIIEDDYDSELRYSSRPIPSIQNIGHKEKVIYIGTFSKSLSPSLRVNYMVLPEAYLDRYDKLFRIYQSSVPIIQQRVLYQFMHLGHYESHLRKISLANKRKHDLLVSEIHKTLGNRVVIHGRNAGLHVLVEVNNGLTENQLIEKAAKFGVVVYPVSMFWINLEKYSNNMVLLGFGGMTEEQIINGIKALKEAWFNN
ncbi:PLP-dependent aminotransferase family protein [Clostridium folliculivorans]|uniref:GntR family transcriptional regulator n=1 Tax=Clostridium folliculivorans TaxID=2886038 RepID=A0A9W5Y270_9CLOT|nr:PLP-dependent aminotransferase family protein [Clostridium folliculivorans]GKU25371.1 GntR family transcriptional regulator [Clostridium folliculivorans]GKU28392.1 GntR family transcriptional regulator [Clostridium folliculivorans]